MVFIRFCKSSGRSLTWIWGWCTIMGEAHGFCQNWPSLSVWYSGR